jgi:UDP-N-acetylmuramyl pentapeptide phosphotransferase/UDP-N-acetylglucosamine-1-phosphate transferase
MRASVIIPAYQAASSVGETVRAARSIPGVSEVIVVDDGSRDGTGDAARRAGADEVISLDRNRGKGAALCAGVSSAHHDLLLFLDADLGESAAQAGPLLAAVGDRVRMAVAALPRPTSRAGLGLARGLAHAAIRLLAGLRVAAPLSGQRAIPTFIVKHVGVAPRFGVEVGLTVEAAHLGLPVIEVPVPLEHRHTGRSAAGFLHRGKQFADVLQVLLLVGYGLGWPALGRQRTARRVMIWLLWSAALIAVGGAVSTALMRHLAVVAVAGTAAWLPVLWVSAVWLGLRKTNYLGRTLPAGAGLLVPLVGLAAIWYSPLQPRVRAAALIVVGVLGAVGLLDDLWHSGRQARGLRGHLLALARGKLTTGTIKALGGVGAGLAAGILLDRGEPGMIALDALVIALSANLINLLDLRPGRALKGFGLLCGVSVAIAPDSLHLLGPFLAAAIVLAPADFAGRVMLGDVGANTLGAVVGLALVIVLAPWARLAAVVALAGIHIICERVSLSDIIPRSRVAGYLDRLGTEHLAELPQAGGGRP